MFVVYILHSKRLSTYYIGHTEDIAVRLKRHNKGRVRSTRPGVPWQLLYTEGYHSKQDAYRRELQIKSYKGGEAFKKLIDKSKGVGSEVDKRIRL